ncbi:phosphotransferase [Thioalkalivibrio sp. ALE20]|uniref:phosphotransferase n=1 Tax=Thioalkalivibrio sp. ALE20 TaxID=545275 RepID=UPI00037B2668|nr:phosphotransferase [Thioalkalivibrio sp. ALE20]
MIRPILNSLKWSSRLGAKFFWAAPAATSGVVFFTLVSQLSMLLAFFLPLKVIILLGSDGIPRYFPPAFEQFDRDALIVSLSAATIAFYGLYLLAERIVEFGGERGSKTLLARSRKMVLFENQDELAARAYKRHAEVIAGSAFLLLALVILFWLYQSVALLAAGYVVAVGTLLLAALAMNEGLRRRIQDNLNGWMGVLAGIGFMLAFGYLVVDFLFLDPPGLIPAIIALLLARQGFNRLSSLVTGLVKQHDQKAKLDALFFHSSVFMPGQAQETNKETIWTLLTPEARQQWVSELIAEMYGEPAPEDLDIQWWQTDVANVGVLHCRTPGKPSIFVKLFAPKRTAYALHEAALLADPPQGLPSPQWIGATQVRGFHCHVLQVAEELPARQGDTAKGVEEIRLTLLQVALPQPLLTRYQRSRPMLWQRLNDSILERLRIAANDSQSLNALGQLRARLQDWRDQLAALPLAITTRDVRPGNIVMTEAGVPTLLHWGSWAMEPAGAGWPTKPQHLQALGGNSNGPVLAALSHELERLFERQRFSRALKLVPRVVGLLAQRTEPSATNGPRP